MYGRIHFKFQLVTRKWVQNHKSGRVPMRLPCCHFVFCGYFPPEVTTDMWFMVVAGLCVETWMLEINCKLQNWMLTLLLRTLFWLLRLFRSWKCAVACILGVWLELQRKSPNSETLKGYILVIFYQKFIHDPSFSLQRVKFSSWELFVGKFKEKKWPEVPIQRFVSVLWFRHAQLRDLVEVWALTGECSPPVRECSPPDRNRPIFFVQTFVDFALSLPGHSLWVCLRPGPWIFSQKRQIRTRSEN